MDVIVAQNGVMITFELDEEVHLCAYDASWAEAFTRESSQLRKCLPAGLRIEHIGSTSVLGMMAKPVVDLMIGAGDGVGAALVAAGYEIAGRRGWPGGDISGVGQSRISTRMW
jgi:GrpB-like predicted nucleotidyltransferase (UPF0157 family)